MPSQARDSSWSCDACGRVRFPSFDTAKNHERQCQETARKRPRSGSPGDEDAVPEMGGDYDLSRSSPPRRFTIMAPDDMYQHQLDRADALSCQNLEVFEAGSDLEGESKYGTVSAGQVGVRCIHCAQQPTDGYSMCFPANIEALGTTIQMVAERHYSQCAAAPEPSRREFLRVLEKRRRDREESRSAADKERSQMAMMSFCSMFCRNCGIVDKFPPQSGMCFMERPGQRLYAPTPHHLSRPAEVPYYPPSGARQHFPSTAARMGDSVASTPLARSKDQQDESHQSFPIFPAPYASGQQGIYQQSAAVQTPHTRNDVAPEGPMSQQQRSPQHSSFPGYAMSPYDMFPPPQEEYPYFQDSASTWSCKYCSSVPPQYCDRGSTWNGTEPPPSGFINHHLQVCRSYHQFMSSGPQGMYEGQPSPAVYGFYRSHSYSGPPPPQGQYGAPPSTPYYSSGYSGRDSNLYPPPQAPGERQGMPPHSGGPPLAHMHASPIGPNSTSPMPSRPASVINAAAQQAIDYLVAAEQDMYHSHPELADIEKLVLDEDRLLLTDYFFFLMKQLRVCRFAEADRKTRGGKRENIAIGFGGMQCIHCAEAPNARKFFWSNVDRLSNSFAEIPSHVLKCRRCPNQTKTAILDLKARHPEQMAKLPRGSQKVFFRRMWRRLHDSDPTDEDEALQAQEDMTEKPVFEIPEPAPHNVEERSVHQELDRTFSASSPGTSTDESAILLERPAEEAARALAAALNNSSPPSPSSRVLLGIPEDKDWLSDTDCLIRRNLEVFCATAEDVDIAHRDRKYPINVGQVGIRCIHCAIAGGRSACRGNAVAYPYSISGVYEAVREFERLHLTTCKHLPPATKQKLDAAKGSSSLSSVLRKYYVLAAKALGMYDTPDGIRSGGESMPMGSSAAFAFTDMPSVSEAMQKESGAHPLAQFIETSSKGRKRKQPDRPSGQPPADAKPSAVEKSGDS